MGPPLVTRQVSNLLVVDFIGRLSLETKPRPKSWPTLSIALTSALGCVHIDTSASPSTRIYGFQETPEFACISMAAVHIDTS